MDQKSMYIMGPSGSQKVLYEVALHLKATMGECSATPQYMRSNEWNRNGFC